MLALETNSRPYCAPDRRSLPIAVDVQAAAPARIRAAAPVPPEERSAQDNHEDPIFTKKKAAYKENKVASKVLTSRLMSNVGFVTQLICET